MGAAGSTVEEPGRAAAPNGDDGAMVAGGHTGTQVSGYSRRFEQQSRTSTFGSALVTYMVRECPPRTRVAGVVGRWALPPLPCCVAGSAPA